MSEKSRRYSSRVSSAPPILCSLVKVTSFTFWMVPVMKPSVSFRYSKRGATAQRSLIW